MNATPPSDPAPVGGPAGGSTPPPKKEGKGATLWIIIGIVLLLLIGLGVGGYLYMEQQKEQDRKEAAQKKKEEEEAAAQAQKELEAKMQETAEAVRDSVIEVDDEFFGCASSAEALPDLDDCAEEVSTDEASVEVKYGDELESVETKGEQKVEDQTIMFSLVTDYSGEDYEEVLTCEPDIEEICEDGEWEKPEEGDDTGGDTDEEEEEDEESTDSTDDTDSTDEG